MHSLIPFKRPKGYIEWLEREVNKECDRAWALREEVRECPQYVRKGKVEKSVGGWNLIRSILP